MSEVQITEADRAAASLIELPTFGMSCCTSTGKAMYEKAWESIALAIATARQEGHHAGASEAIGIAVDSSKRIKGNVVDWTGDKPVVRRVLRSKRDNFDVNGVVHYGALELILQAEEKELEHE